jgi:hypothetical protein
VIIAAMISRFKEQYKKNALPSTAAGRFKRAQKQIEERHASRTEQFSKQRNLSGLTDDTQTSSK